MKLRTTRHDDLDFIYAVEHDEANARFITPWERSQHQRLLDSSDTFHAIIADADDRSVGFLFVNGLQRNDNVFELKRLVAATKGRGIGRFAVQEVKKLAFGKWNARRLWLDVRDFNERARRLYESEGFKCERAEADNLIVYGITSNAT
jgi:ribosomal protein S18 acetylase RimI-like enzyme